MNERKRVAAPPDDGHIGSSTTPEHTLVETDEPARGPELNRDGQKAIDTRRAAPDAIIIAVTVFLVLVVLAVYMPRFF
jgi:hypothetical protein